MKYDEILPLMSKTRLRKLKSAEEPWSKALERYANLLQSNSVLYPYFHLLEITFRNRVHQGIAEILGNPEWLLYFLSRQEEFHHTFVAVNKKYVRTETLERISFAHREGEKTAKNQNRQVLEGDIISNLEFGFWTRLIGNDYERKLAKNGLYSKVFVNYRFSPDAKDRVRQERNLKEVIMKLRQQRNRLFHHELLKEKDTDIRTQILDMTGHMSKKMQEYLEEYFTY